MRTTKLQDELREQFGAIDIYLFDQLLKGRLTGGMNVLDAGCGVGRNLAYLLRNGVRVWGVDVNESALREARRLAAELAPCGSGSPEDSPAGRFLCAPVEKMPFATGQFDFVICNAVLHFARDEQHFHAMVRELARVLKPGGVLFARLMSLHGIESLVCQSAGGRHWLPDGMEVFLVHEALLRELTDAVLRGELLDPIKSTIVHGQRTMTTWVAQRGA